MSAARTLSSQGFALALFFLASACTHDLTWIASRTKHGGVIGYPHDSLFTDRDEAIADFAKRAKTLCKSSKWVITKETIPVPMGAAAAVGSAARGDVGDAVMSGGFAALGDQQNRAHVMAKGAPVVYGNPLKSWNEATIKCGG